MNTELVLENLKKFDRKERGFLVRLMTGMDFTLGEDIKEKIEEKLSIKIPDKYFTAMDYHLDWIYASLYLSQDDIKKDAEHKIPFKECISGTQEDMDWIVVYKDEENESLNFVLIEAKGDASFSNKQMESKIKRLGEIFCDFDGVNVYLLLVSPKCPEKLVVTFKHDKFKFKNGPFNDINKMWLSMPMNEIQKIVRHGKIDTEKEYECWKVK